MIPGSSYVGGAREMLWTWLCGICVALVVCTPVHAERLPGDLNNDYRVEWRDFNQIAANWEQQCNSVNNWCSGADINRDGSVTWEDFSELSLKWQCVACQDVQPDQRMLDCPDSWLVLYDANNSESAEWAQWYAQKRSISASHLLGLAIPEGTGEILWSSELYGGAYLYEQLFVEPIQQYFDDHPEIADKVMGIIVGYGLPGTFVFTYNGYRGETQLPYSSAINGGGFSIAGALQYLPNDYAAKAPYVACENPFYDYQGPLTKAILNTVPGTYVTVRIDAPDLEQAKALTERAVYINTRWGVDQDLLWYADMKAESRGNEIWYDLRDAVTQLYTDLPWQQFSCETSLNDLAPAYDLCRFDWYAISGWNTNPTFDGEGGDLRAVAYNLNSFGMTTLRSVNQVEIPGSTVSYRGYGRYCPNALFRGGYAAAIGATAEPAGPGVSGYAQPDVRILIDRLRSGCTVAEAYFMSNPYNCWMWELAGDPFVSIDHLLEMSGYGQ